MGLRQSAMIAVALLLAGCSSLLVSSTPAPVYFRLDYQPPTLTCPTHFGQGVRVQTFAASSPFDQPAMVVEKPDSRVSFSSAYQWVAPPGTLLAQSLQRDLTLGPLFPQVVGANSTVPVPLQLTGHLFSFAWVDKGSGERAELQVEVSLIDTETQQVLLRKNYQMEGAVFHTKSADTFAQAMASLTRRFSKELQRDLCQCVPAPNRPQ